MNHSITNITPLDMINDIEKNNSGSSIQKDIIERISKEFLDHVFSVRNVKPELKSAASGELLICLGMYMVNRLKTTFTVSDAVKLIKYYVQQVCVKGCNNSIEYHDMIRLSATRHDFYVKGLPESMDHEDFIRTVGMQWFQFPFEEIDGSIRPLEFDFSHYFSDIPVVRNILLGLAPDYANQMVDELIEYGNRAEVVNVVR